MDMNKSQSVSLLFAGQGNPLIGMGSDLWDLNSTCRHIWDCASDISGLDIRRLCLKGPMNKLIQTTVQQIAVTAINVTLFSILQSKTEDIDVVGTCGHSVGEYAALFAAKAISLEDLFRIIHFRSMLMNELSKINKGSMLAVKGGNHANISQMIAHLGIDVDISCDNSPLQQVIGGTHASLREITQSLNCSGLETTKLSVSGAWHTRLIEDGVQSMRDFLAKVEVRPPQYDVLMNVTGVPEYCPLIIRENLSLHLTHTVKWTASIKHLLAHTSSVQFIEISNKAYLQHMLHDFEDFIPDRAFHCKKYWQ